MNLKCMINGRISGVYFPHINAENKLLQGNTISEDYSEVLDSGSIILTNVPKILDLQPYDDVFIWNSDEEFNGYNIGNNDEDLIPKPSFYRHFLVDRYTEERNLLNQDNYTYKIELFSETKGLENIILPNIKITQPLNITKKINTAKYMKQYLEMYSPKIKVRNGNSWQYVQKYKLSKEAENLFSIHYCQELSLNSPTLRELFTKLMVSKDCIPVVKDNVIYPLCLAKTRGAFDLNKVNKSFIVSNKTSDNYVTQFRTNYNNALAGKPTCHRVERLGFRNSDDAIMTINNMRLETSFPIYKINKIYACYYKKCVAKFNVPTGNTSIPFQDPYYFLCKQDITDFCVLNNERQSLYKDARMNSTAKTVEEMKKCYYFTVGYSIGSNLITGFGETYSYLKTFGLTTWNSKECGFRNLIDNLNDLYPWGIDNPEDIKEKIKNTSPTSQYDEYLKEVDFYNSFEGFDARRPPTGDENVPSLFIDYTWLDQIKLSGDSTAIKGITFLVDYEGFYNGAVITNKEVYKGRVEKTDNQSDSLPIMDIDGIAREKKIEKMGNKMYTLEARYTSWADVQDIGTVFEIGGSEENQSDYEEIIIYHRDIAFYDNCINVTYFGQESFVLKNFYTSVFAKQRLYNVLAYGNSVTRAENVKDLILMSKTKKYNISPNFSTDKLNLENYLSCFENQNLSRVNNSLITLMDETYELSTATKYHADVNTFIYGNSMCFNVKMFDNITMGENFDKDHLSGKFWGGNDDRNYVGSTLYLCSIHKDRETGRCEYINVSLFSKMDDNNYPLFYFDNTTSLINWLTDELYLPVWNGNQNTLGTSVNSYTKKIYKDANEIIDMTLQTQVIVDKKDKNDIYISSKMLELSDLVGFKNRMLASNYYSNLANKIVLVPFQYKAKCDYDITRVWTSLLGFIVRVPNGALNAIREKVNDITQDNPCYGFDFLMNNTHAKTDSYSFLTSSNNQGQVNGYQIRINSSDALTFVKSSNDKLSIRIKCYSMYLNVIQDSNVTNFNQISSQNNELYFYLKEVNKDFIQEKGIDKNDYTYFSNVLLKEPSSGTNGYFPMLVDYFENNELIWGTNQLSYYNVHFNPPSDNIGNQYNNFFYGYTATNGYHPNEYHGGDNSATLNANNYSLIGKTFRSHILNYFDKSQGDYVDFNHDSTKDLLTYAFKTDDDGLSDYPIFVPYIRVFYDLATNIDSYGYFSWDASSDNIDDNILDNTIVCVAGPKIETSLAEEKVASFSGMQGYNLLMNGNSPLDYTSIFNVIKDNENSNTGKLHIDLTNVPSGYNSIQMWVRNVEINAYEFVCGFNIGPNDNTYIDIYLSLVGDLDLQVFENGILYGKIRNLLDQSSQNDVIPINSNNSN